MKYLLSFALLIAVHFTGFAQVKKTLELSATKIIGLKLKPTLEFKLIFFGKPIEEITIYGTEKNVIAFYYKYGGVFLKQGDQNFYHHLMVCDCGLASKERCLQLLGERGFIIQNISGFSSLSSVSIQLPNPGDYNSIYRELKSQEKKDEKCDDDLCLKICKKKVCISYECKNEIEICYDGEFSVSLSNGQVTAEAKLP